MINEACGENTIIVCVGACFRVARYKAGTLRLDDGLSLDIKHIEDDGSANVGVISTPELLTCC